MNPLERLFFRVADRIIRRVTRRPPDFIVGRPGDAYLLRWYLTPWRTWYNRVPEDEQNLWHKFVNRCLPNAYLHKFLRDDDDRALHDHPWPWCSILLRGSYIEHTIDAGGIHRRMERTTPSIKFSLPSRAHRVELLRYRHIRYDEHGSHHIDRSEHCWTLFVTGPRVREWGFHCPERGWVHWRVFTNPDDTGQVGAGCEGAP